MSDDIIVGYPKVDVPDRPLKIKKPYRRTEEVNKNTVNLNKVNNAPPLLNEEELISIIKNGKSKKKIPSYTLGSPKELKTNNTRNKSKTTEFYEDILKPKVLNRMCTEPKSIRDICIELNIDPAIQYHRNSVYRMIQRLIKENKVLTSEATIHSKLKGANKPQKMYTLK